MAVSDRKGEDAHCCCGNVCIMCVAETLSLPGRPTLERIVQQASACLTQVSFFSSCWAVCVWHPLNVND